MPVISIIVPNYNHASFLKRRLDSIFNQTFQDFEVILLDDFSSDGSIEILNEYSKNDKVSHFIVNKENSGSTFRQWKRGIELSKGEFVWIAESDDYADIRFLEKVLAPMQQKSNVGLAYCQSWRIDDSDMVTGNWSDHTDDFNTPLFNSDFLYKGFDFANEFLIHKNVMPNASALIFRKSVYERSKGVNLKLKYCGDWFLWLKISILSDIFFISESLNYFRRHENSVIYRANKTYHSDKFYLQKSDNKMRKYFSSWLKQQHFDLPSIIQKNNYYINRVNLEESGFFIYDGSLIKSFIYSIKYLFLTGEVKILTVPVKRSLFQIWRFAKKAIHRTYQNG